MLTFYLRTMSKLRETHPEMAYQIDQTIMNVGLRLPTPSPSQSPANSARSISSRTSSIRSVGSSKSNLPIGSARTQRSDIQAQPIKQGTVQNLEKCELLSYKILIFWTKNFSDRFPNPGPVVLSVDP